MNKVCAFKFPQFTTDELREQIETLSRRVLAIKRSKKERKANKAGLSALESALCRMSMELARREGRRQ